jgi:hypothetical protein
MIIFLLGSFMLLILVLLVMSVLLLFFLYLFLYPILPTTYHRPSNTMCVVAFIDIVTLMVDICLSLVNSIFDRQGT